MHQTAFGVQNQFGVHFFAVLRHYKKATGTCQRPQKHNYHQSGSLNTNATIH